MWATVLSEQGIWLAYMLIAGLIVYLAARVKPEREVRVWLWFFASFVFCCGQTHAVDSLMFWHPVYRLTMLVNLVTVFVSWAAVFDTLYVIAKLPHILETRLAAMKADTAADT